MSHMVHSCIYVYVSACTCIMCTIYMYTGQGINGIFPINYHLVQAHRYPCSSLSQHLPYSLNIVIISVEQIIKDGGGFEWLLKKLLFISNLIGIVINKAYCISTWGEFCLEYRELGKLKYLLPMDIPFLITSATLSSEALRDIKSYFTSRMVPSLSLSTTAPTDPTLNLLSNQCGGLYTATLTLLSLFLMDGSLEIPRLLPTTAGVFEAIY